MINYNSQRNQEWENAIKCRLRFQYPVETEYWGGIRWILDEDGYCQMSSDQNSGYLLHTTLPETNSSPMKIPIEILVNTIQNGGFSNQLC